MSGSPLEEGTKSQVVCAGIRKRKGLKEQIPPLENFVDKL
jgi:elongation factor 2